MLVLAVLLGAPACGACDAYSPVEQPLRSIPVGTLEGAPVDLASYRGRPLVVHFWLPHCGVCAAEVPALMEARRAFADTDVVLVAVSVDPDVPSIRERSARFGLQAIHLVAQGEVLGPAHVGAAPSTVFVDRQGIIRAAVNGPRSAAFLKRRIRDIL